MKANPNVTIVHDNPVDNAKVIAMAKSGNVTWSTLDATEDLGLKSQAPYLEKLDCSMIPCDELIGDLTPWRVPMILASMNIGYRTDKHANGPQTWADFFDTKKFPGKRAFWDVVAVSGFLEFALISDGVKPTQGALYPLDVDRAYKKLDTIKNDIVWYSDLAAANKLLADGEIDYMAGFNGRLSDLKKQGVPVKIEWAPGTMNAIDYFVIPKGAKHVPEIMKFIAYCTSAENCGKVSNYVAYGPPNKNSKANPKIADDLPTSHKDALFIPDDNWWAANTEKQTERYKNWV
jgi:putative spermidine/putrescine transport system substrate-binding protein